MSSITPTRSGRAIGLNTAIYTLDGGSIGIGFAIPASDVKFLIDQVRRFGRPHAGWLGIEAQKVTPDMGQALALPYNSGLILSSIEPSSPAAKAGLQIGDVILRFGVEGMDRLNQGSGTDAVGKMVSCADPHGLPHRLR